MPQRAKSPSQPAVAPNASVDAVFAGSEPGRRLQQVLRDGRGSQAAIADFLLRNPVRATAWGIEELATQAATSTASLSRFARSLGYEGFSALRSAMAEAVQAALQPVFHPVAKLREAIVRAEGAAGGAHPSWIEGVASGLENHKATIAGLDPAALAELAAVMLRARTVYTLGFGLSAHLAALLSLGIQPYCQQVVNVVEYGGTEVAAGRLMNLGPDDLLVALSFPRYASDAVALTQFARDQGARIVAITDSMASPLAGPAHTVLLAPASHPVLSSSSVSAVVAIEALVTSLMLSGPDQVRQAQKLTEAISAYLYDGPARDGARRGRR